MPDLLRCLLRVHTVQGIAAAVHALIEPGDEAVLLEPAYDSYAPSVGVRASMHSKACCISSVVSSHLPRGVLPSLFCCTMKQMAGGTCRFVPLRNLDKAGASSTVSASGKCCTS